MPPLLLLLAPRPLLLLLLLLSSSCDCVPAVTAVDAAAVVAAPVAAVDSCLRVHNVSLYMGAR